MNSSLVVDTKFGQLVLGGLNQGGGIQSIEIEESVVEMGGTCKVTVPQNIREFQGKSIREFLNEGDKAYVYFGYNGELALEFSGYLLDIPTDAPMQLTLADEFYPFRKNKVTQSYKAVTLKQLLNDIAPGYKIVCPGVNLGKQVIDNATTFQVLKNLNETYGFYSYIRSGTLFCQFAYDVRGLAPQQHTYYLCDDHTGKTVKRLGNVRKNDLKYKKADATDIRIEVVSTQSTGKKVKADVGSKVKGASVRKLNLPHGQSEKQVKEIAEKMHKGLSFDGFRGSITGYGIPRTNAGDSLNLVDFDFPDKNGIYLIEKVIKKYSDEGIERENTLSYKI